MVFWVQKQEKDFETTGIVHTLLKEPMDRDRLLASEMVYATHKSGEVHAVFFHFSAKSSEVLLPVNCARVRRGLSVTYISDSAPRICSSNACVVKFVAHQLHMVIKGEYLIILFPSFLSCFFPLSYSLTFEYMSTS